jgi:hypothetical protein
MDRMKKARQVGQTCRAVDAQMGGNAIWIVRQIVVERGCGLFTGEVQIPQTVIPLKANLSPSQGYLRIGIKGTDVGPC